MTRAVRMLGLVLLVAGCAAWAWVAMLEGPVDRAVAPVSGTGGIGLVELELYVLDLRLKRRADVLLLQELLDAVLDRALQRIALERFAVHLADEVGRDLAGAEAGHPHLGRDPLHFLLDPRLDVLGGDGEHEGALQALILGLNGLDAHVFGS